MTAGRRSVLVISHTAVVWGAQTVLLDRAPRLADLGFELTMAGPPGDLLDAWRDLGLPVEPLVLEHHRGVRAAHRRLAGARQMMSEAAVLGRSVRAIVTRARRFDLLQSHSLYAHLETAIAGRIARRPVVLDFHDYIETGIGRHLLTTAARLATHTVANSAATADLIRGAKRRITVVHPGVDLERFEPGPADPAVRAELSAHPDAPLVGILGRVDPPKGVDTLVDAMVMLRRRGSDACLVVVGAPLVGGKQWAEDLEARARAELDDRVRFLGPRSDPERVFRALDVLVNASRHEAFGRTVLEAQASGVAVVGTNAGGIPEFVEDGETGLLVPPRAPAPLADAIERVLGDEELRVMLCERGRAQAEKRFRLDAEAEQIAEVYRVALGEQP